MPPIRITNGSRWRRTMRKVQAPLLPGDIGLLKQMEKDRKTRERERDESSEKLEETGVLEWPPENAIASKTDLDVIISSVRERMFEPPPKNSSDLIEFRQGLPKLAMVSQLYGVFPDNATYIDRLIASAQSSGAVKVISVNLPNCTDMVIATDVYLEMIPNATFGALIKENPDARWFSRETLMKRGIHPSEIHDLVSEGFLTVNPSQPGVHNISVPGQGRLVKLVLQCRKWLVTTLTRANKRWRELPENALQDKLLSTKMYWKTMRGVTLEWILYDAIGSGHITGFQTPIGRGWMLQKGT